MDNTYDLEFLYISLYRLDSDFPYGTMQKVLQKARDVKTLKISCAPGILESASALSILNSTLLPNLTYFDSMLSHLSMLRFISRHRIAILTVGNCDLPSGVPSEYPWEDQRAWRSELLSFWELRIFEIRTRNGLTLSNNDADYQLLWQQWFLGCNRLEDFTVACGDVERRWKKVTEYREVPIDKLERSQKYIKIDPVIEIGFVGFTFGDRRRTF
ncbi:hypothetical protein EDD18DRAFT_1100567 [Armillaria luteobubalina]|uniref:Uncharacterized protein n=1 Tax=Armillaria luteobubalina TaxID=153913 RepID=A0AA39QFP2_9AGAR|nr:hypothetical protein EDD18DRAFT_1100567 [Armillaria luteobubalina]